MPETDIVTAEAKPDPRQLDFFEKDHGSVMSMSDFATWVEENYGQGVTKAIQTAAFMLCCDVISQDISKSTLRLREWLPNGTSRIVHPMEHEIAGMLALEPNRRHTWPEFVEMMVLWSCLTQNAYAGVLRNNTGDPLELIPFQTGRVQDKIEGRDVFYDVTASLEHERALLGRSFMTFHERDMIHVRGRMLDGMEGYSTLKAGKTTLDTSAAIEDFRNKLFGDEGQIRGVFTRDKDAGPLDEVAFQRVRTQFKILMNKFRQLTEPIILEGGIKFEPISSKPADLELTKQFEAQINEVCRLLRVPPHKVFAMSGVKYENLETMEKAYVGDTLIPTALRFETRYGKVLLNRKDRLKYFFQHDRTEMTLRDTKNETERAVRSLERGGIDFDEFRAIMGFNPLANGQGKCRMIPVNMTVVDAHGKVVITGSAKSSKDEDPKDKPADDGEAGDGEAGDGEEKAVIRLISSN